MNDFCKQLPSFSADIKRLESAMSRHLSTEVPLISEVGLRQLSGGKQLRALIALLCGRRCGLDKTKSEDTAAAIEFIHTATLLHDDVVDDAPLRRQKPTANRLYGNAAAVLVGDFLYSRASQIFAGLNNIALLRRVAEATNKLAEGEVIQLIHRGGEVVDETVYYSIIQRKTANLFEIAAAAAALLASPKKESALAKYGRHLGIAFQLVDDCLDYAGDSAITGKKIGADYLEGKMTLPLILTRNNLPQPEQKWLMEKWRQPTSENFGALLTAVRQSGALQEVQQRAEKETDAAVAAINTIKDFADKNARAAHDSLITLARLTVGRQF